MSLVNFISEAKVTLGEKAVLTDAATMAHYTISMRNRHTAETPAVVLPETTQQVTELVKLARVHGIALVPQGGNTGLVDGGLPRAGEKEVIINLSRMSKIRDVDAVGMIATVEAGAILHNLHAQLAECGLMFPLHIASEGSAEIGGLISANAGGHAALRYGVMRHHVLGLEVVLPNGEILSGLKSLAKDNTGYHLASYFIGAEGTLGIVTAATLRLLPALRQKLTAVVAVADIRFAIDLLGALRMTAGEHLSAFEFMSQAALNVFVKNISGARFPCSTNKAPYYLLIELSASSDAVPLRAVFEGVLAPVMECGKVLDAVVAESETQEQQFWHARDHIPDALRVEKQRVHFDIALPIKSLADFLTHMATVVQTEYPDIILMPFGHIGDGNVHYNMYFPTPMPPDRFAAAKKRIQDLVFGEVDRWQGSISAEHGVGVERKEVLARLKPKAEIELMRAVKRAFDPQNLINPGKIFD